MWRGAFSGSCIVGVEGGMWCVQGGMWSVQGGMWSGAGSETSCEAAI